MTEHRSKQTRSYRREQHLAEFERKPGRIRQLVTRLLASTRAKVRPIDTAPQSEPAGESAQPASPTPLRPREA